MPLIRTIQDTHNKLLKEGRIEITLSAFARITCPPQSDCGELHSLSVKRSSDESLWIFHERPMHPEDEIARKDGFYHELQF